MQLSDLSVKRPVFAAVMAMLMAVVGIVGFFGLSVREYPDVDPPIVSIQTQYIGAAANVIETRVTEVLEDQLAGIPGLQTITSRSQDGQSQITIEFAAGTNIDSAANDVRDRVGAAAQQLPTEIEPPVVRKVDADAGPIMFLVVSRPGWSPLQLSDWVDRNLVDRFSSIDGVARVFIGGEARPAMRIWLRPERLAGFGLTPADVETALTRQNVELPAGRLEFAAERHAPGRAPLRNARAVPHAVVGRGADGYLVRLGDVARVEQGPENPYSSFRLNGSQAVGLGIVRQSGANTLAVADAAKAMADQVRPTLPEGMTITVGSDDSQFISRAIEKVWVTLAEAAVLVVLVIYLFLGSWRATLIPAVTVPLCLLASFAVLWLFGFSINLLTLLSMVLAIGIVVDDAIVVLENIYHRIEEGEPPLAASFNGARQVGFAIISTTMVVCAVFVPIMFIAGQTGLLFRELAAAMIGAVAFSGFFALSLAPMLCSKLLRQEKRGRLAGWIDRRFRALEGRYAGGLDRVLRKPLIPVLIVLVFLGGAGFLYTTRQAELVPRRGCRHRPGQRHRPRGHELRPDEPLCRAGAGAAAADGGTGRGALADYPGAGRLRPERRFQQRQLRRLPSPVGGAHDQTTAEVASAINREIGQVPAVRGNAQVRNSLNRGRGQQINFVIAGATYADLARVRDRILAAAADNPGIVNLDSDYKENKPQLRIQVDTSRAGDLGVSVADVSNALQTLLGSRRVSTYIDRGREYRVVVQAEQDARTTQDNLAQIYVRSRLGTLVPLVQPGADRRGGGRARPRPLQQVAGDHPVGRSGARLFARRGARLPRKCRGPVPRGAGDRLSRREPGLPGSRRLDLFRLPADHLDRLSAARRPVRELRPSRA